MSSVVTTYDPDREKEPREVQMGRLAAEVKDHGWVHEKAWAITEPPAPVVNPCYRCGKSKAAHRWDGVAFYHAYVPCREDFDGDGDPMNRNDLFGRNWVEQDADLAGRTDW